MQYRREIDGLRSVAVLPVILFHAGFSIFSGGYVGVDVFFVISGFLITTILLREIEEGRYSLLGFYERRARRILPALFVVILACLPVAWVVMVPYQLTDFAQSVVATLVFASNFLFLQESGYFQPAAELKPLLHTWSLAVEEQYYVVIPLLLAGLYRFGGRAIPLAGCAVLAVGSLGYCLAIYADQPSVAFYMTTARAWELLAGSLLAFLCRDGAGLKAGWMGEVLAIAGLAMIVAAICLFDSETPFPSAWTLVPVVGTCLIIGFARAGTLVARLLSLTPFVFVGLISYSAYLWHQPLLAFARIELGHDLDWTVRAAAAGGSLMLAGLTWILVEQPARNRKLVGWRPFTAVCVVIAGGLIAFGIAGHRSAGFYDMKLAAVPEEARALVMDRGAEVARALAYQEELGIDEQGPFAGDGRHRVLILGDSMSKDLFSTLRTGDAFAATLDVRRAPLDDACLSAFGAGLPASEGDCAAEVDALMRSGPVEAADEIVYHAGIQPETLAPTLDFLRAVAGQGRQVSLVGITVFDDVSSLSLKVFGTSRPADAFFFDHRRTKYADLDAALAAGVAEIPGVRFLDKAGFFCDEAARSCPLLTENGDFLIFDGAHLTVEGYTFFADAIARAGWFDRPGG